MKVTFTKIALLLTLALGVSSSLFAQSQGISYQAVILNPNQQELPGVNATSGVLPNKEISLRFTILNTEGGTDFQEVHKVKTDAFGMVNLFIGDGEPVSANRFSDIDWDGTPKNLQVEIDFEGGNNFVPLSTQKLTYVPFGAYKNITTTGSLTVDGVATFKDDFSIAGKTTFDGDMQVNGQINVKETVEVDKSAIINQDLQVNGTTSLAGTLQVNSPVNLGDNLTVQGAGTFANNVTISGKTNLVNELTVAGAATFEDDFNIEGQTKINGDLQVGGNVEVINELTVQKPVYINDSLQVNAPTVVNANLKVAGSGNTHLSGALEVTGSALLSDQLDVNGRTNINNNLSVTGGNTTNLSGELQVVGASLLSGALTLNGEATLNQNTTLNAGLSVAGLAAFGDAVSVSGVTSLRNDLEIEGNTTMANLVVSGDGHTQGEHIALFENTGGGNADGIAIRIDNGTLSFRNRFVTFYGRGNYMAGRIESFDLYGGDTYESFPVPNFATLFNVFDFNNVLTGGSLPTLSFTSGSLPTASFSKGSLPSMHWHDDGPEFHKGSLPSLSFNGGSLPTATLTPGSFPTLNFDGFFDPQAGSQAQTQIGNMVGWGMRNGSPGFIPMSPWQIALTPVVLAAKQLAMNQGVIYGSKGADYAEWLEKENPKEKFVFGEVVGVKGGKISKVTEGADHVLTISMAPIVLGNMPDQQRKEAFEKVGFMGQLPVLVVGDVQVGDYIVASGYNDGYAKAIAPDQIELADLKNIIGKAWSGSDGQKISLINVSVGLKTNEWVDIFKQQENRLSDLEAKLSQMENLQDRLDKLEAALEAMGIN